MSIVSIEKILLHRINDSVITYLMLYSLLAWKYICWVFHSDIECCSCSSYVCFIDEKVCFIAYTKLNHILQSNYFRNVNLTLLFKILIHSMLFLSKWYHNYQLEYYCKTNFLNESFPHHHHIDGSGESFIVLINYSCYRNKNNCSISCCYPI